ncbi:MAG TPA: alpha/beta hydrolase [Trebonia sp.]|nr:alpha/beta hydrolase [Trebonia sp.]
MTTFASYDGTEIFYRDLGHGAPLVCLPGGPARAGVYLGDLGGLSRHRRLIVPDQRGSGESGDPADPATLRVDRLVEDVEALRLHLGLERMDLLAHSAGAVLATMYAAVYPQRLSRLLLITPGLITVDHDEADAALGTRLAERSGEPWYAAARPAADAIILGDRSMENQLAARPFYYGRWDEAAREHAAVGISPRNQAAREGFLRDVKPNVPLIREGLARVNAPVLLYVGERDPFVTAAAARAAAPEFSDAVVIVQPEAGHYPWIDDPAAFSAALADFLGSD